MPRQVLVIDDHSAIHRGLEEILVSALRDVEVGHARTAQEAFERLLSREWDAAILDLSMPGSSGLELIQKFKDQRPKMRILVYTMHAEEQFGVRALRAGADGYLTKDSPEEELPRAILSILAGRRYIAPQLEAEWTQSLGGEVTRPHQALSDREFEVLEKIALGKTPSEIAGDLALSVKTVSTYRTRVLEKLRLRTTADLIRYAVQHGIVSRDPDATH